MRISVIIPTYKPQNYLWECLDSLTAQTFPKKDFEVVLVLNGCAEPYKSSIGKYIEEKMQGMNVNFIQTDVGGVSNARNIALDNARGEYVTFIDDDDFVSPDYLKELSEVSNYNTMALCYPYAFNDGNVATQVPYRMTSVYEACCNRKTNRISSKVRKYFSGPWMKLIPMSFIQERRFDVRFKNGEDSLFMFLISDKFKHIAFTSKKAVYYRRYRESSAVTQKRRPKDIVVVSVKLVGEYTKIWFQSISKYNFFYYIVCLFSIIKGCIVNSIKNL